MFLLSLPFFVAAVLGLPVGVLDEKDPQGICDTVKQHAGYFKLTTGDKNYFYWSFASRNDPSKDPVVLWMTGGPGCSSSVALFGENGPCKVTKDGQKTTLNPYSWNQNASLIYIDQPTGTGFSYGTGFDHNESQVADDMYSFLTEFFTAHTEYSQQDFYIFGESYAGHYVPAVSHRVWKGNQDSPKVVMNLKGIGIGNGLTDPEVQYSYYPDMAASSNDHKPVFPKNGTAYKLMESVVPACVKQITACNNGQGAACEAAYVLCNDGLLTPYILSGMNPYDMRVKCAVPPLCYDFSNVATFLALPNVVQQLGVAGHKWKDCNRVVDLGFLGDWMKNYQTQLPDQLADNIRVLIYAGDQDYICNWLGNKAWTLNMTWPGHDAFNQATDKDWNVDGKKAGELRSAQGFNFLRVLDAGHMVPLDQPANAQTMLNQFIANNL